MENIKGRVTSEKCPTFYKEKIKHEVKSSRWRDMIASFKLIFKK